MQKAGEVLSKVENDGGERGVRRSTFKVRGYDSTVL